MPRAIRALPLAWVSSAPPCSNTAFRISAPSSIPTFVGSGTMGLRLSICRRSPRGSVDEVHAWVAERASGYRGFCWGHHRDVADDRARGRSRRGPCRLARPFRRRARHGGASASQCRSPEALHRRCRRGDLRSRVRRAQRTDRHEGCLRQGRHVDTRIRDPAQEDQDSRRREQRHAVFGTRARCVRRARFDH